MFSKACEYAMKAMIYIKAYGADSGKISLNKIDEVISSPVALTETVIA